MPQFNSKITKRISGTASGGGTTRISGTVSSHATRRVSIDPILVLEGDEVGILLLEGDAQDGTDGLKIEGDAAVVVATARVTT